jgi:hypothetical protein
VSSLPSADDFDARRKAAYAKLDEVIDELNRIYTEEAREEHGDVVSDDVATDAVLVIGSQSFDEDGDRTGCVTICPRGGSQPAYITAGLLAMATVRVTN